MQQMIFIADLIACLTCFGHHYAHHQNHLLHLVGILFPYLVICTSLTLCTLSNWERR